MNYYNDNDPFICGWLKELIADGLIPKGDIDDRSITDVKPSDLDGYIQCHFFAGVGGWAYALRLVGWPANRPVWTGSCPCQPFSVAGKGEGINDERHLWPAFRWLIAQCRPATIFGEQVASKDGRLWLSGVRSDLEAMGYAVGASDLCAAGIGAPQIRQRLWWVAQPACGRIGKRQEAIWKAKFTGTGKNGRLANSETPKRRCLPEGFDGRGTSETGRPSRIVGRVENSECFGRGGWDKEPYGPEISKCGSTEVQAKGHSTSCGMADMHINRRNQKGKSFSASRNDGFVGDCSPGRLADHHRSGRRELCRAESIQPKQPAVEHGSNGVDWTSIWWPCQDGKYRRIPARTYQFSRGRGANHKTNEVRATLYPEPALFPLASGLPNRVGILRGAGNSIAPELAAEFIKAFMEAWEVFCQYCCNDICGIGKTIYNDEAHNDLAPKTGHDG